MLDHCLSDNGPQLTAAFSDTTDGTLRDKALAALAAVVENVVFELTDIMVGCRYCRT